MSHVLCVCSAPIIAEARARGLCPDDLVEGLELGLEEFEDPRGRVPWRDFVVFARQAAKMLGTETLEDLAAGATVEYVPRPIRRVLPRLGDSRPLFTFAARWWGPWVFHGTRGRCEVLADGRLREVVRILPEHAPCPEFLAGIRGTLRGMPRLLGQPEAQVTVEQDGREAEYIIVPPPRRTSSDTASRFRSGGLGRSIGSRTRRVLTRADREELSAARAQLLESRRSARDLSATLEDHTRRLDTLGRLADLLVRENDAEELQQQIAELMEDEPGVGGVRLSLYGEEGISIRTVVSGTRTGAPVEVLALSVAELEVGELELWSGGRAEPKAGYASLLEFAPWIALALELCGSKARVTALLNLLNEDLRDWERMERRLERLDAQRIADATSSAEPAVWPADTVEAFDLARLLHDMEPRLRQRAGDDVPIELRCAEGLWPFADPSRLDSFIESVVEILCAIGSDAIVIEARAVAARGHAMADGSTAEILIRGSGAALDTDAGGRLREAYRRFATAGVLDIRDGPGSAVGVCVFVPLLAPGPGGRRH